MLNQSYKYLLPSFLVFFFACERNSQTTRIDSSDKLYVRNAHSMAYDASRHRIVLLGGAGISQVCGDTWEWANDKWVRVSTGGPTPRTFASMAYNKAHKQVILFSGNQVLFGDNRSEDTFLNDMWGWNGEQWNEITKPGPSQRAEACMAFDSQRNRVVLFGGYNRIQTEINLLGDTWEWNGEIWQKMSESGPPPQNGCAMVYDECRQVIVFWGQNAERTQGETWEWNGQNWNQVMTATTARRYNSAMTYDRRKQKTIRFGGWSGEKRTNDVWEYDGIKWRKIETSAPAARNHSAIVYDIRNNRAILFGGHDGENVFGDTWAFNDNRWNLIRKMDPIARVKNNH